MKRNLLICIDSLRTGGAERLVAEQLPYFADSGWIVHLMTFSGRVEIPLPQHLVSKHVVLGECSNLSAIGRAFRYCRAESIDLAICHLERSNKWLGLGARLAGCNVLAVVHNIGLYDGKSGMKKLLLRWYFRTVPAALVAVSSSVADYLHGFGLPKNSIVTIPNGVDVRGVRDRWQSADGEGYVLCVLARLEKVKGLDLLLQALAGIDEYPWRLKVIGDGSCRGDLERQAQELGVSDRIEFCGQQQEPFRLLHDVAAICMPSLREGLPMALLECQALGLPAIVSDAGYLPTIIEEGRNGCVCQAGSVDSLTDALRRFLSADFTLRQGMSAQARLVADRYDIRACVAKYEGLAESVCGR